MQEQTIMDFSIDDVNSLFIIKLYTYDEESFEQLFDLNGVVDTAVVTLDPARLSFELRMNRTSTDQEAFVAIPVISDNPKQIRYWTRVRKKYETGPPQLMETVPSELVMTDYKLKSLISTDLCDLVKVFQGT